jgi:hypothetical protein
MIRNVPELQEVNRKEVEAKAAARGGVVVQSGGSLRQHQAL